MKVFYSILQAKTPSEILIGSRLEDSNDMLLGSSTESPRAVYRIPNPYFDIFVISSEFGGGKPIAVELLETVMVVCFDGNYTLINMRERKVSRSRPLEGVFYEIIDIESDTSILIVHELGLIKVASNGDELWSRLTDIVESVRLFDDCTIAVKLYENSREFLYDSKTGKDVV